LRRPRREKVNSPRLTIQHPPGAAPYALVSVPNSFSSARNPSPKLGKVGPAGGHLERPHCPPPRSSDLAPTAHPLRVLCALGRPRRGQRSVFFPLVFERLGGSGGRLQRRRGRASQQLRPSLAAPEPRPLPSHLPPGAQLVSCVSFARKHHLSPPPTHALWALSPLSPPLSQAERDTAPLRLHSSRGHTQQLLAGAFSGARLLFCLTFALRGCISAPPPRTPAPAARWALLVATKRARAPPRTSSTAADTRRAHGFAVEPSHELPGPLLLFAFSSLFRAAQSAHEHTRAHTRPQRRAHPATGAPITPLAPRTHVPRPCMPAGSCWRNYVDERRRQRPASPF
jgi:hypothetical protein